MAHIYIESHRIAVLFQHMYLVFKDDNGNEFVIRGGPQNSGTLNFGKIVVEEGKPIQNSLDIRSYDHDHDPLTPLLPINDGIFPVTITPEDRHSRELDLGGRNALDVWNIMLQQVHNIAIAALPYEINTIRESQNSNSTVSSVLNAVGIAPLANLPIGIVNTEVPGNENFLDFATLLNGTSSADIVRGYTNNDTLLGWEGSDAIYGGTGNDYVNGNMGTDVVNGEAGNDLAAGGKDNDTVYGGLGDDTVNGNLGADVVYGNEGSDTVRGGKEADAVYGGEGNDTVYGDLGNDLLSGSAGADVFVFVDNSGIDTILDFDALDSIRIQANINGSGITGFTDIAGHTTQTDSGISLDLGGGNSVLLAGITAFDSGDFVFV
jgi:Ca2+-binding RTX toxin-like protein